MKKAKLPRYVTPIGVAKYPYLAKPDTKFNPDGDYKVNLEIDAEVAGEVIAFLDEQFAASVEKAKKENPGKKIKAGEAPYTVDEDSGKVTLRFKLKAKVSPKEGDPFTQKPAMFDAKGKPLVGEVKVGGGSKLKVAYEVIPFYTSLVGAGLSLRLRAVQVIELVEFGGGAGAGDYGFGEEEGYAAPDNKNENGFTDESSGDDEDF